MAGIKHPGQFMAKNLAPETKKPNAIATNPTEVPLCLRRLVRTILKTFYTTEHAIVMNILLRNTIMKEDDLCERLRFDRKLLRQLLHTLKTDQFIKSKVQLETEVEGKTSKITHYFIDFKVFVNIVKYRLDMMHKRLEGEQRDSSSRANYRCASCDTTYTDLEIDRLIDPMSGSLKCTYCNSEVTEQEDSIQRAGACAQVIAKFNQQIRRPIDELLQECEQIHLSSAILEPEIRPLEPLPGSDIGKLKHSESNTCQRIDEDKEKKWALAQAKEIESKSMIRVVVDGTDSADLKTLKERPVWLRESTVQLSGLGDLDRDSRASNSNSKANALSTVQTLTPGRIPQHLNGSSGDSNHVNGAGLSAAHIMELLMVHEKRQPLGGPSMHPQNKSRRSNFQATPNSQQNGHSDQMNGSIAQFECRMPNGTILDYRDVNLKMLKTFNDAELAEYRRVGKALFAKRVFE